MPSKLKIVDLFCGAGGTSEGARQACAERGIAIDLLAVNHWDTAIATHTANHPGARHLCSTLEMVKPTDHCAPDTVDILWASPSCTHHSRARGGAPVNDQQRATAYCVLRWAEELRPKVIFVENVPEFMDWGPVGTNGRPLATGKGKLFRQWMKMLEAQGYRVDVRILCAADYGDPTTRRRMFVQAVRGRRPILWPDPSHAPAGQTDDLLRALKTWRPAREIIEWDVRGSSIYQRKKPLKEKTMKRIMAGLEKFGLKPFVLPPIHGNAARSVERPLNTVTASRGSGALVQPYLVNLRGTAARQLTGSARDLAEPLPAVTSGGVHSALCTPFLIGQHGGAAPRSVHEPVPTVATAGAISMVTPYLVQVAHGDDAGQASDRRAKSLDHPIPTVAGNRGEWGLADPYLVQIDQHGSGARSIHEPAGTVITKQNVALAQPFLVKYFSTGGPCSVEEPLDTVTTKPRFGLAMPMVQIGQEVYLVDIHFRMLTKRELARAQGFPDSYQFTGNTTAVVKQIGNAVPTNLARALVAAVLPKN